MGKKKICTVGIAACGIREKKVKEVIVSKHLHRYCRYLSYAFISSTNCAKKWGHLCGLCHETELLQHAVSTQKEAEENKHRTVKAICHLRI